MAPTYDFAHTQQAKSLSKALDTRVYLDTYGQWKRLDADIFESEKKADTKFSGTGPNIQKGSPCDKFRLHSNVTQLPGTFPGDVHTTFGVSVITSLVQGSTTS